MQTNQSTATQPSTQGELQQYQQLTGLLNAKIDQMNSPAWKKYQEYQISRYDEQIMLSHQRLSVLQWQEFASNVMLWVVVLVVASGVGLSALQLWHSMQFNKDLSVNNVQLDVKGLKITSSVVGIVILGMSIAFVLIFVKNIYTITPLDLAPRTAVAESH